MSEIKAGGAGERRRNWEPDMIESTTTFRGWPVVVGLILVAAGLAVFAGMMQLEMIGVKTYRAFGLENAGAGDEKDKKRSNKKGCKRE